MVIDFRHSIFSESGLMALLRLVDDSMISPLIESNIQFSVIGYVKPNHSWMLKNGYKHVSDSIVYQ